MVYTDRLRQMVNGVETEVIGIISARYATEFGGCIMEKSTIEKVELRLSEEEKKC